MRACWQSAAWDFALSAGSAPLGRALLYFAGYSRLASLPGFSSTRCGTLVLRYVLLYLQAYGARHHFSTLVPAPLPCHWIPLFAQYWIPHYCGTTGTGYRAVTDPGGHRTRCL